MEKMCPNCSIEMVGGYKAKMDNSPFANFTVYCKGSTAKVDVWVCPRCGKIEFYVLNASGVSKKEG